jgi:anaerobic ribonucleoside-triphosphate reductase activating protein
MQLRISGIEKESVVDGPGLRFVVFAQGCNRACPDCHNPDTWSLTGGELIEAKDLLDQILSAKLLKGVTFSGGEPFLQARPFAWLGQQVKKAGLDLITYTGYIWEELQHLAKTDDDVKGLLLTSDYIVDGPYLRGERSWDIPFRGSQNQRFIDTNASIAAGWVVQCFERLGT